MPAAKAQQKAVTKYMKNNYDVFQIRMPKGKKQEIKAHSDEMQESLNAFIKRAIDETIARDKNRTDNDK
jgi:predicted HicB family RNase H-like nuclease